VRLGNVSQPIDLRKACTDVLTEISPDASPPRRFVPLSEDDRARRLAEIRLVLADATPDFRARAAGESEGRP
jgi:hypothetical protein